MIKIRNAKKSDISGLIRLYSGIKEIMAFPGEKHEKEYFSDFMKHGRVLLVAEENKKIMGALNAEIEKEYVFLNSIVVSKQARKKGIGNLMLNKLEELAKEKKVKSILFLVYDWNRNMRKFCENRKYKPSKKLIIYSKKLQR